MSRALGSVAEQRAVAFLCARGFTFLEANYTCRTGEIDLICLHGDTLVFVEVRSRAGAAFGDPLETISREKCRRIISAARLYLYQSKSSRACRFDVVTLVGDHIAHMPDAFTTTDL